MITYGEKLIIETEDTKLGLKRIFEDLSASMIEYYDKNYLTKAQLKSDIQEAWMLTMMRARKIDEKNIKEECLNERNEILKNNQNLNSAEPDQNHEEKIKELKSEIKELKEELQKEKINIEKTDIAYLKKHEKLIKLENEHNARGAGRKRKITDEQITLILMYRAQNKPLKEIAEILELSYGSVQNISKNYTRLEDIPKVNY